MKALNISLLGLGAFALMLSACSGNAPQQPVLTKSGLDVAKFDTIINGDSVLLTMVAAWSVWW